MTAPRSASWLDDFSTRLAGLDAQHLRRTRRVVRPLVGAYLEVDGERLLGFCSNDYLGLADHPALVAAACAGAQTYGVGAGASPLVSGHSPANAALEPQLAAFAGLPRALYFYAGYAANAGIVPALVSEGDAVFCDALNHACLIDGARLSKARIHRYPHANLAALECDLAASPAPRKLILTDAVFSMDGDIADVPGLLALAEHHDALLLIDDAHGFGVIGPQGRGCAAHFNLHGGAASPRLLYMATLGKAAGVAGAFVAGSEALIEWLLQTCRSYIFATAPPAMLASALQASLQLIEHADHRRSHLQALIARLRSGLASSLQHGDWQLGESVTAIQPLRIGSNAAALAAMAGLRQRGLWVPAIRPPTVPAGTARLRIALSARHTLADVDRLVQALCELAPHPQA
ncbi:MAG: 8-amino-7-oxononanoate synthase [Polaromonas sp.]|nr:8-amino-7-oxononanoate synthase [Polaromonas sp.]